MPVKTIHSFIGINFSLPLVYNGEFGALVLTSPSKRTMCMVAGGSHCPNRFATRRLSWVTYSIVYFKPDTSPANSRELEAVESSSANQGYHAI
jgi:hypothetical protein